jgi:alanine racemase
MPRHAAVHVDLDAVSHNVAALRAHVAPAELCVVVKADGYGHGAEDVAAVALDAGADRLAVALVEEGQELRDMGIDAPILLLSQPPADAMADALAAGLTITVDTAAGIDAAAAAASAAAAAADAWPGLAGDGQGWSVHLKVDTGMHRVGCAPHEAVGLALRVLERGLALDGTFTHLAVADEPRRPETAEQLARFHTVLAEMAQATLRTPPAPSCTRTLGSTWCASASPPTAWDRLPTWIFRSTCTQRCRWPGRCRTCGPSMPVKA